MTEKILAKVEGRPITESQLAALYQSLGQNAAQFQGEEGKQRLVEELINQELFLLEALEKNVEETEAFQKELAFAKENMLKQFSIRQLLESVEVSEEEMKDFYEQNQDRFEKGEEVTASHILVKTEDEAKAARERVVGGEAFGDVAQDVSTCPSKERGGDLGAFSKGRMVPEFEQAAFDMEVDEISEPVKTQFGYHIIKVTDKSDASKLSYDETKGEIRQRLTVEKQNKVYLDKVEALKGAYDVEIVE